MASFLKNLKCPKAILFDYDGVLVASEPIHLSAWMQLLDELGLPPDKKMILDSIGKTAPEILSRILDRYRPGWNLQDYPIHSFALRKNDFYLSLAQSELRPYAGVKEGLEWLQSRSIPCAVVSNGRRREVETTLRKLGLFDFFQGVTTRDDVQAFKPDPTPYLFTAEALGFKPEECLAVEDSPTGLEAALLAQVPVAAIATNFSQSALISPVRSRPDLSPVWVGESIEELFACLRDCFKSE